MNRLIPLTAAAILFASFFAFEAPENTSNDSVAGHLVHVLMNDAPTPESPAIADTNAPRMASR